MLKKNRGLFIVFEGIDSISIGTQIDLLGMYMKSTLKLENEIVRFPDKSIPSGKMLDEYVDPKKTNEMHIRACHLLFAFNRWEKREYILKKLDAGVSIIADRYAFSRVAYSMAHNCDQEFCLTPDKGLPRPDLVLQIDIDPELSKERSGEDDLEIQKKIREKFDQFKIKKYWRTIDGSNDRANINKEIIDEVEKLLSTYIKEGGDESENNYFPSAIGEDLFFSTQY